MSLVVIIFFLSIFAGMALLGFAVFIFKKRQNSKHKKIRQFSSGGSESDSQNSIHQTDDTYYQSVNAAAIYTNSSADDASDEKRADALPETEVHREAEGYVSTIENSDFSTQHNSYSSSYESSASSYESSSSSDSSSSCDSGSSSSSD